MPNDSSWDDLLASQPATTDTRHQGVGHHSSSAPDQAKRTRRRRRRTVLVIALVLVGALGIGAAGIFFTFEDRIRNVLGWEGPIDYEGEGTGEVVVTITDGQVGGDIATLLAEEDVVMTYKAFYSLLLQNPEITFQPGNYALRTQMSAQAALDALQDPANRVEVSVGFNEGLSIDQVLESLSESSGIPLAEFEAAAADPTVYGVGAEAPSLEGYLFPARYTLDPRVDAPTILQTLVDRTFQSLDAAGVAAADRHRVLTIAALIQREAGSNPEDFYKVSRVIQNRLDSGTPLQMDSTAQYGYAWRYGERLEQSVFSKQAELDDDNAYNTYQIQGLPLGPIGAAGDLAIDAAVNPADGPWLFFVTVNLDTGETAFTTTGEEHNAAVRRLQAWCEETNSPNCA
ncbi:endolytic transglycosylase MltG [Marisediminicola sp. UYEF4]|uniref:endolytic transglycosylase MltG n=1 Tax=Marisediminicola sp. UYEF4 TaxID=1756384 RepID=UPI0033939CC2